jgi:hypothetical protein
VDGNTWGQSVFHDVMAASRRQEKIDDGFQQFGLGCSGSFHPAAHRFPVWWTGDIFSQDLGQSIKQMVQAGFETLMPYVHPDCTAHHNADPPEVYVRWIQFCSLGTIMRMHSDPYNDRRPWNQGDGIEDIFRNFVKMRLALTPALASASMQASIDATPPVARLDFQWPQPEYANCAVSQGDGGTAANQGDCSTRMDQYMLALDTLVAPVDPFAGLPKKLPKNHTWTRNRTVFIPPGEWTDAFDSSTTVTGPKTINLGAVPMETMPLYHRRGSIVVGASGVNTNGNEYTTTLNGRPQTKRVQEIDWDRMILHCWPRSAKAADTTVSKGIPGTTTRSFYDSSSRAPQVWHTELSIGDLSSKSSIGRRHSALCTQLAMENTDAKERLVVLQIGAEGLHSGPGSATVPSLGQNDAATPSAAMTTLTTSDAATLIRTWIVRVHLQPGERVACATTSTGSFTTPNPTGTSAVNVKHVEPQLLATTTMPFGDEGAPAAGGKHGGAIAELVVEMQAAQLSTGRLVTLSIASRG